MCAAELGSEDSCAAESSPQWARAAPSQPCLTLSHHLSDQWLTGATANLFGGRVDRFFGQLEDDSNAGVWVRRQF